MKLNLDEIEAYCEKATSGPWIAFDRQISKQRGELILQGLHSKDDDLKFCARARTDLPLAVKELRETREALHEARGLLEKIRKNLIEMGWALPPASIENMLAKEINAYLNATKGEG